MPAYAIAHLYDPTINDEVLEYIERIQSTMDLYEGRFLVHGAEVEVIEGAWPGTIVVLEFPDVESARAWYASPGYQEILPLRTDNISGTAIIVPGVDQPYDATNTATALRAAATAAA